MAERSESKFVELPLPCGCELFLVALLQSQLK